MEKRDPQSESDLWLQLKDRIGLHGHFCRVESHEVSNGIPDVDYCLRGTESHIELKFHNQLKLPKDFIRPSQVRWFRKRIKAGGRPWLLALFLVGGTRYYMLFDDLEEICRLPTIWDWEIHAKRIWREKMNWTEFLDVIS